MSRHRLLLALVLAPLFFSACDHPRRRAERVLAQSDVSTLRRDAAVAIKNYFAARGPSVVSMSAETWPKSFTQFRPSRVFAYPDGVAIILQASGAAESGLYVQPEGLTQPPESTARTRFTPLREGIYWCEMGGD